MDKQTLHGIGLDEGMTLEIKERGNDIEFLMLGTRGGIWGMILVGKKEFMDALVTMYEQIDELPF